MHAAFKATPTNSMNFRGNTPFSQGLPVMVAQIDDHDGSQVRSVSSAESQGPVSLDIRISATVVRECLRD